MPLSPTAVTADTSRMPSPRHSSVAGNRSTRGEPHGIVGRQLLQALALQQSIDGDPQHIPARTRLYIDEFNGKIALEFDLVEARQPTLDFA